MKLNIRQTSMTQSDPRNIEVTVVLGRYIFFVYDWISNIYSQHIHYCENMNHLRRLLGTILTVYITTIRFWIFFSSEFSFGFLQTPPRDNPYSVHPNHPPHRHLPYDQLLQALLLWGKWLEGWLKFECNDSQCNEITNFSTIQSFQAIVSVNLTVMLVGSILVIILSTHHTNNIFRHMT